MLQNVPNRCWEVSGLIQSQYSAPHGLMTPETPDSFLMHVDSGNHYRPGQEDVFTVPQIPRDFPNGFYPNYHARYVTEFILSNLSFDLDFQSSCSDNSFQLLSDYPITKLYTNPTLEPIWAISLMGTHLVHIWNLNLSCLTLITVLIMGMATCLPKTYHLL